MLVCFAFKPKELQYKLSVCAALKGGGGRGIPLNKTKQKGKIPNFLQLTHSPKDTKGNLTFFFKHNRQPPHKKKKKTHPQPPSPLAKTLTKPGLLQPIVTIIGSFPPKPILVAFFPLVS